MLKPQHVQELRDPAALIESLLASGYAVAFEAHGSSMLPVIRAGDKLHVDRLHTVEVGDVVLARLERGLTAHRLVRVLETSDGVQYITRGDNCDDDDPPFASECLLGVVTAVTRDGEEISAAKPGELARLQYRLRARVARATALLTLLLRA